MGQWAENKTPKNSIFNSTYRDDAVLGYLKVNLTVCWNEICCFVPSIVVVKVESVFRLTILTDNNENAGAEACF